MSIVSKRSGRIVDGSATFMKTDTVTKLLLLSITVLLALNLLVWNRPATAAAQSIDRYKMLVLPVNADGIKTFEQESNQNQSTVQPSRIPAPTPNLALA